MLRQFARSTADGELISIPPGTLATVTGPSRKRVLRRMRPDVTLTPDASQEGHRAASLHIRHLTPQTVATALCATSCQSYAMLAAWPRLDLPANATFQTVGEAMASLPRGRLSRLSLSDPSPKLCGALARAGQELDSTLSATVWGTGGPLPLLRGTLDASACYPLLASAMLDYATASAPMAMALASDSDLWRGPMLRHLLRQVLTYRGTLIVTAEHETAIPREVASRRTMAIETDGRALGTLYEYPHGDKRPTRVHLL